MSTIQQFLDLLSLKEKKRALLLVCMVVIMALLDVAGVASVMPFIAVLANPQLINTNAFLSYFFTAFRFEDQQSFFFALGLLVFAVLVTSLFFKALTTYAQTRFAFMCECSIGRRLVEGYLRQPYSWFLNRHSTDLGKTILSEVNFVIGFGILPLMSLITHGAVTVALLVLLVIVDPLLALSVGLVLGISYGGIFAIMSGWLKRLGQERIQANQERFTAVSEAFSAAKEVKAAGLEQEYIKRFTSPAEIYAKGQATAIVIGQLPRFLLEAIAFGGMLLIVLYLIMQSGSIEAGLPIIALYAFTGYRLLPALQQVYGAVSQLRFVGAAVNTLHSDLISLNRVDAQLMSVNPVPLTQAIAMENVTYCYPNSSCPALKGVNIIITARSSVGFVGTTGSGKTTAVDIILGLLEPQEGSLSVDGQIITDANRRAWQQVIGYVPQHIYLTDDSIIANIAFGVNPQDVNLQAVERAAKVANLHEFITGLPNGYGTAVGERGVRLSGGQRQRIGIARALYRKPQVLILDEATSALDNLTEQAVMDAINNVKNEITLILIAHRLSTVRNCDRVFFLEHGEVIASGSYDELTANNHCFAAMASNLRG